MSEAITIERLSAGASEADVRDLARVLVDAVQGGAAVSFLQPLEIGRAENWWRGVIKGLAADGGGRAPVMLVARDGGAGGRIVGTVQAQPAWAPNQPHRAEVCKMLVHSDARRRGVGRRLMEAIEQEVREAGWTLLTLDARAGGAAEALYRAMGWTFVGVIPDYAIDADGGGLHDTVIFYKRIGAKA